MRERIEELLGIYPLPSFVGTFHRFALRLLRRYGPKVDLPRDFSILDTQDQLNVVKKAQKAAQVPEDAFRPRAILAPSRRPRTSCWVRRSTAARPTTSSRARWRGVYQHYQSLLRESGAVDFDDMIRLSVQLLRKDDRIRRRIQEQFPYLLVDEFQDTNHAQLEMVKLVAGEDANLTAVGDEDQSIYRWRGADLRQHPALRGELSRRRGAQAGAQLPLDTDHSRRLGRRGRAEPQPARQDAVDRRGRRRQDRALPRSRREGRGALGGEHPRRAAPGWRRPCANGRASDGIPWSDMAVLVRTNAQTRALEEELLRRGLSYNLVAGVRFYERAEIKDLVAYLRLLRNPDDVLSFERVLNRPPRGIGKKTSGTLSRRSPSAPDSRRGRRCATTPACRVSMRGPGRRW